MMNNSAYQTNVTADASGQLTDMVIVPPLGEPLKDALAASTATQIANLLGSDREQFFLATGHKGGFKFSLPATSG